MEILLTEFHFCKICNPDIFQKFKNRCPFSFLFVVYCYAFSFFSPRVVEVSSQCFAFFLSVFFHMDGAVKLK